MDSGILMAIIGVGGTFAGTLGGTALGWFLNQLSGKGKLYFYNIDFNETYDLQKIYKTDNNEVDFKQVDSYSYRLNINVYSSSNNVKIMNDFKLEFYNNSKLLYESIPLDYTNETDAVIFTSRMHSVNPINILPKSINPIYLERYNDNSIIEFIRMTSKILLSYQNEKGKRKSVKIKEFDYSTITDLSQINHKE